MSSWSIWLVVLLLVLWQNASEDVESYFLSSLFHVGQLVSGIVLQVEDDKKESGKRKVWLSLRLALLHKGYTLDAFQEGMVMSAYVKSIEDHGYILDFGVPSFTGFMPKQGDKVSSSNCNGLGHEMAHCRITQKRSGKARPKTAPAKKMWLPKQRQLH